MSAPILKTTAVTLLIAAAGLTQAGCTREHLSQDFGVSLRQNLASQTADPDARYVGDTAPGSDGSRVGLAQERYQTGKVIPPASATANVDVVGGQGSSAAPAP